MLLQYFLITLHTFMSYYSITIEALRALTALCQIFGRFILFYIFLLQIA